MVTPHSYHMDPDMECVRRGKGSEIADETQDLGHTRLRALADAVALCLHSLSVSWHAGYHTLSTLPPGAIGLSESPMPGKCAVL